MKNRIIGLLLRFCPKKYCEEKVGFDDYVVCYKMLFGQKYIFTKTLSPPKHFNCRCTNGVANNYFNLTTAGNDTCTRPDITDCHAKGGTGGRCMNGVRCPPLQVK